jgi:hypothetical protein
MNQPNEKSRGRQLLFILLLVPLIALAAWSGFKVYNISNDRADIKDDYMEANSIMHGILNMNNWREDIKVMMERQIDEFELTPKQDSLLREQVADLLHEMLSEAQKQVESKEGVIDNGLKRFLVKTIADWEKLHKSVPDFTNTIVNELTTEESKERLKLLATSKFEELANTIYDDTLANYIDSIYSSYGQSSLSDFNEEVDLQTHQMAREAWGYTYIMLVIVGVFLLMWFLAARMPYLKAPLFILSVALALAVLITGLSSPMIEIDVRIAKIDFTLLGEKIEYADQMIFYRSKSILQVVHLMLQSTQVDSLLVGFLILAFSVLLPISKLISAQIYLLGKPSWRKNKVISWLVYKSGKWSMADVMVVAIFMSFVAFDGILDAQLEFVKYDTEQMTSIGTNLTSLRPGFILFVVYVLYGLFLAFKLKQVVDDKNK